MHSWSHAWTERTKKTKIKPTATSKELGEKTGCWEQKQRTAHASCTQLIPGPTPMHNPWNFQSDSSIFCSKIGNSGWASGTGPVSRKTKP